MKSTPTGVTGSSVVHAFADESYRKGTYLICAAIVAVADLDRTRRDLRALLLPGQRRLHFADEGDRRRRLLLSEISRLPIPTHVFSAAGQNQTAARDDILFAMVPAMRAQGVTRLVMDSREGQDHKDRTTIRRLIGSHPQPIFEYSHERSQHQPLLWVPDAVAWAFGRGGQWRKRVEDLGLVGDVTVAGRS